MKIPLFIKGKIKNERINRILRRAKIKYKERCEKRNNKYEPELIEIGAVKKADGIYELDEWLLYPTKGFAMNKKHQKQRMNLQKFIKQFGKDSL